MPIQFTCPHCGRQSNVADQYAGQSGPCAGCGKTITIPSFAQPAVYGQPVRRSQSPALWIIIGIAVLGVIVVCGGILLALMLPAVSAAREAARRSQCTNNLKQLGLAMHEYHDNYKCFPPAYIPDEDGKPMHSWRVLLLPYLEQQPLYEAYNFDEPWDSPGNLALAAQMPPFFRCPSDGESGRSETSYAMLVGPQTISDGPTANGIGDIKDGTSNTILLVEVTGSGINWLEPRDVDVEKSALAINNPAGTGIRSNHPGGVNILFCDGAAQFLSETIDPQVLKGLSTINGGEPVRYDDW
jgi:prepilin-type processing-associated H-X9-DG protein